MAYKKVEFTKKAKFFGVEYKKGQTLQVSNEAYKQLEEMKVVKEYKPTPKKEDKA